MTDETNFEPVDTTELSPTRAELIARVRARGRQIRARRRLALTGLTALVVLAIAAPAIAIGAHSSSHSVPPATHVAPAPVVTLKPTLSTSIELPAATFVAGSEVQGTLVIDNPTGATVTLEPPGTCHAKWDVSLEKVGVPLTVAFTTECGSQRTVLQPGANRFPVTVATTYTVCTGAGGVGSANQLHCLPGAGMPPLPPGAYQVVLSTSPQGILPTPPAMTVHVTAVHPSLGALGLQTGRRSIKLLVPSGWKFTWVDAGGSGSSSTWTNPTDAHEQIKGTTGVEVGGWWQTDGVKGSINPRGLLPAGAHIDRVNRTTFLYQVDAPNGDKTDGVWIADLYQGLPYDYVSGQVTLPAALHSTATTIIDRFISDRKALPPSLTRP